MKSEVMLACITGGAFLGAMLFGVFGAIIFALIGAYVGYKSNKKRI
jgi:hypothetical protein